MATGLLLACSSGGTAPSTSSNPEVTTTSGVSSAPSSSASDVPSVSSAPTSPGPSPAVPNTGAAPTPPPASTSSASTVSDPTQPETDTAQTEPATHTLTQGDGATSAGADPSRSTAGDSSAPPPSDAATVVPDASWACGVPEGLPPPELGQLVFEATIELGDTHEFGETQYGKRRLLDVAGATFSGSRISGSFLTGGLELELELSNGNLELEQIDILRADDGALIYLRTCGFAPSGATSSRFVPDFEAPTASAYAWLNTGKFAGTRVVDEAAGTIELAIYDVTNVALPEPKLALLDPDGTPHQPWECAPAGGSRGATVFTETVTLGQSLSVGASKRGTRNVIPITGGTVSGRLTGSIVPGGADYQLIGNTTVLDARYTLVGDDGEYVLVRNCGPFGALIPQFEARKDGPYAFLNEGRYLSSDPGGANGGVSITFYEAN